MIQRRLGRKCSGPLKPRSCSLVLTGPAVFVVERNAEYDPKKNTIPTIKHETGRSGAIFLLRTQDDFTVSKSQWMGPCAIRSWMRSSFSQSEHLRWVVDESSTITMTQSNKGVAKEESH